MMVQIDVSLVRRLIDSQFPQWANLPIKPVEFSGWDNRTFHLGNEMTVRLPSDAFLRSKLKKNSTGFPILLLI